MRFDLDGLDVFFPYEYLYNEQFNYMLDLKRALDAKGHGLIEMPTGTGKTVCLIALITSYQYAHPEMGKLIYCTRTVPEMTKCIEEVKKVIAYRVSCVGSGGGNVLALSLSSRRNLCIHPKVLEQADGEAVNSKCRSMTASWVRKQKGVKKDSDTSSRRRVKQNHNINNSSGGDTIIASAIDNRTRIEGDIEAGLCEFYENYERFGAHGDVPRGVYNLEDLKDLGESKGWCPYFLARQLINHANILVYNYQYMLDPKVSNLVSKELEAESVVVFDEAHNIDNVCIEALSVILDKKMLDDSAESVKMLNRKVQEIKASDRERLTREYQQLVDGITGSGSGNANPDGNYTIADDVLANPLLPADILEEAVPGSIRRAEHFVVFLRKLVEFFKSKISAVDVEKQTPLAFLNEINNSTALERKPLKFTYSRLNSLIRTLELSGLDNWSQKLPALMEVANFATLLATYLEGFVVITEPQGSIVAGVSEELLQLCCLDASIAIKPVLDRFQSVIITSGTLSPIDLYPKLLNFNPRIRTQLPMSIFRDCLLPLVITKGDDQQLISTSYEIRKDDSVIRNYGQMVLDICTVVPDGICVFFTSYMFMEHVAMMWDEMNILQRIREQKLIFFETKDVMETSIALDNYKRACDCGKGALFLSVARGKTSEGIDFDRQYGRCVILLGVPYQYTLSHVLRSRLEFMRREYQIRDNDFLTFDALRQSAQCMGRVIRSKTDYGVVVLADARYNKHDKRSKFPPWIQQFVRENNLGLSTSTAVEQIKKFLRIMGQPIDQSALQQILMNEQQVMKQGLRIKRLNGNAEGNANASAEQATGLSFDPNRPDYTGAPKEAEILVSNKRPLDSRNEP